MRAYLRGFTYSEQVATVIQDINAAATADVHQKVLNAASVSITLPHFTKVPC